MTLSRAHKSPAAISKHLKRIYYTGAEGMTEKYFWEVLAQADDFQYFRDSKAYGTLLTLQEKQGVPYRDAGFEPQAGCGISNSRYGKFGFHAGWMLDFYLPGDKIWIFTPAMDLHKYIAMLVTTFFPPPSMTTGQTGCPKPIVPPVKPTPPAPGNLEIDLDTSKPIDADSNAILITSKVDYESVLYIFKFTDERGLVHQAEPQGKPELHFKVAKYAKPKHKTRVEVQTFDPYWGTSSGFCKKKITLNVYMERSGCHDIKSYLYKDDNNYPWNEADFDIPMVDINVKIVPVDGLCQVPYDRTLFMYQAAVNGRGLGVIRSHSEDPIYVFNPVRFNSIVRGRLNRNLKPGDVITFSAMTRCVENGGYNSGYVRTRKFTISEP